MQLFCQANKYDISSLRDHCVPHVVASVNRENCLQVLVTAHLHENDAIRQENALETLD